MVDFSPTRVHHTAGSGVGSAPIEGSAYVLWLQNALHQQTTLLNEKNDEISQLQERLTEAERLMASGHGNKAGVDPDGFLIERVVDEEERNAKLEAQHRDDITALQQRDALIASMKDEIQALQDTLKHNRRARHEDVVKTHMEWAAAHLVHNPSSLPLEAVGVVLEDVKNRRRDLLHVTQRIEDWYGCLLGHYYTTVQLQQHKAAKRPAADGVSSYTAEIRKNADVLFNRIRGECMRLTHDEIEHMVSPSGLYKSRADAAAFASAFRTVKSIVQSAGPPPAAFSYSPQGYAALPPAQQQGSGSQAQGGIPVNIPSFWVKDGCEIRLDAVARAQLSEACRELVLCYDSNPRTIQATYPKLVNELHLNAASLVTSLRAIAAAAQAPPPPGIPSAMETAAAGIMAPPLFPVSLLDARVLTRGENGAAVINARNAHNIAHVIPPYAVFPEGDPTPPAVHLTPLQMQLPLPATPATGGTGEADSMASAAANHSHSLLSSAGSRPRGREREAVRRTPMSTGGGVKTSVTAAGEGKGVQSTGNAPAGKPALSPFSRTHSAPSGGRQAPVSGTPWTQGAADGTPGPSLMDSIASTSSLQGATVIRRLNLGLAKLSDRGGGSNTTDAATTPRPTSATEPTGGAASPLKSRLHQYNARRVASPRIPSSSRTAAAAPTAPAAAQTPTPRPSTSTTHTKRATTRVKSPDPRNASAARGGVYARQAGYRPTPTRPVPLEAKKQPQPQQTPQHVPQQGELKEKNAAAAAKATAAAPPPTPTEEPVDLVDAAGADAPPLPAAAPPRPHPHDDHDDPPPPPPPEETPPDTPLKDPSPAASSVSGHACLPPPPPANGPRAAAHAADAHLAEAQSPFPAGTGAEGEGKTHPATPTPVTPPSVDGAHGVTPEPVKSKQLPDGLDAPATGGRGGHTPKTPPSISHSQSDTPPLPVRNDAGLSPVALAAQMGPGDAIGGGPSRQSTAAPRRGMSAMDDTYAFRSTARYDDYDDDDDVIDVGADGFLTEAQRREVKERAMGNFKVPSDDAMLEEVTTTSRADMMRQLMSWSGQMNTKLANRGRERSEEAWSDDDEGEEDLDDHGFGSPGSEQEFDEPLDINHPDYMDPATVAGPSILKAAGSDPADAAAREPGARRVTFNEDEAKAKQDSEAF